MEKIHKVRGEDGSLYEERWTLAESKKLDVVDEAAELIREAIAEFKHQLFAELTNRHVTDPDALLSKAIAIKLHLRGLF
jgi:hypothetical protein